MDTGFKVLVGVISVAALLRGWVGYNQRCNANAYRRELNLDELMLRGSPEAVRLAAVYRIQLRERVIKGLLRLGLDAHAWLEQLQRSLRVNREADWWLGHAHDFNHLDDMNLILALSFGDMLESPVGDHHAG